MYRLALTATGNVASSQNVGLSLLDRNVEFTEFCVSPGFKQDGTILGASREAVYRSTNGGLTWVPAGYPGES